MKSKAIPLAILSLMLAGVCLGAYFILRLLNTLYITAEQGNFNLASWAAVLTLIAVSIAAIPAVLLGTRAVHRLAQGKER